MTEEASIVLTEHPDNVGEGEKGSESTMNIQKSVEQKEDEFAYINKGFTSEIFKIEIKNLPRYYGASDLRNLLNEKLKCNPSKIKVLKPGSRYAFACFRNEADRESAIKKISGYDWKSQKLLAIKSKPSPDPLVKKRNQEQDGGNENKKRKTLEESTTPLAHLSYEEQLKEKQDEVKKLLRDFINQYWKCSPPKRDYIQEQRKKHDGLIFELSDIIASPLKEGYRNKCEFTIGKDSEGKITVGQRLGSYVDGSTEVGGLDNLKHISSQMKKVANIFEKYIEKSGLQPFNNESHEGHFKCLLVRQSFSNGDIMISVGMNPQKLIDTELSKVKQDIVRFFTEEEGKDFNVKSLYFQKLKKRERGELFLPYEFLWGNTHIIDEILGLKFRISPQSFFQINTDAAGLLYDRIGQLAQLDKNKTILLDVCCGIGTIGLCLSKQCKQVLGVEIIDEAIKDAKFNSEANDVNNCIFTCANSDDWIRSAGKNLEDEDEIVAIVDPPRAGLRKIFL